MAVRPYWSGNIRLSLVSFEVTLTSAIKRSSQIPLHEYHRKTRSRIHHQNVTEDGTVVERSDIVKGYPLDDDQLVLLEEKEINAVKLPSSDTLELTHFVSLNAIPPSRYERPYFVLPHGKNAKEIYATFHRVLQETGKAGIGQIAMRGREELCALLPAEQGLMLETLRYDAELQDPADFFDTAAPKKPKDDYVTLARQLIDKNTHAAPFAKFHDHYHEALQELIDAKRAHRKPRYVAAEKPDGKVINFVDALKKSLNAKGTPEKGKKKAAAPGKEAPAKRRRKAA